MNEHDEHERPREAREASREAERAARRAERDARREERHRLRAEFRGRVGSGSDLGARIREQVERGLRGFSIAFDEGGDGGEATEVVEKRFETAGVPRLRIGNVSGETDVSVGAPGEVLVRARKRVRGWSEDRARRLLQNVEVRMEQDGDEIVIEPRLFEQERGWQELFRGGRVAVDLDVRVPREVQLSIRTVSGESAVSGVRGPVELVSVSGDVQLSDVQGPLRLRTVSADASLTGYAGQLEANSVSGDIEIERSRVRTRDIVTVSGDVKIDAIQLPADGAEGRIKTVSGDVEIALAGADAAVDFTTLSGDAEVEVPARIEKEGRRDRRITVGAGGQRLRVKTVSGDLTLRGSEDRAPAESGEEPFAPAAAADTGPSARDILERLARGEIGVDEAAAALDTERAG